MHDPPPDLPPPPSGYSGNREPPKDGCLLVVGSIGGFVLFFVLGFVALAAAQRGKLLGPYLILAALTAVWLATKRDCRGLALGIFLGLGVVLLIWGWCSAHPFPG